MGISMKLTIKHERSRPGSDSPSVSVAGESVTYVDFDVQDEVGQWSHTIRHFGSDSPLRSADHSA